MMVMGALIQNGNSNYNCYMVMWLIIWSLIIQSSKWWQERQYSPLAGFRREKIEKNLPKVEVEAHKTRDLPLTNTKTTVNKNRDV